MASDAVRQREMKTISNAAQFAVSEMQRREGGGNAVGDYSLVKVSHSEVADSGNGAQTLTLTLRIIKDGAYQARSRTVPRPCIAAARPLRAWRERGSSSRV